MSNELTISFEGPFSWPGCSDAPSIFKARTGHQAGIYLWTVPRADGHLVYYVGETGKSFRERLLQHYMHHASGMYHVYDPKEFSQGRKTCLWPGRFDVSDRKSQEECILEYPRLSGAISELTQLYRFFLATLSCDRRMRCRVEAAISLSLYSAPGVAGSFQDQGIHYEPRKDGEDAFEVVLTSAARILGLPSRILA